MSGDQRKKNKQKKQRVKELKRQARALWHGSKPKAPRRRPVGALERHKRNVRRQLLEGKRAGAERDARAVGAVDAAAARIFWSGFANWSSFYLDDPTDTVNELGIAGYLGPVQLLLASFLEKAVKPLGLPSHHFKLLRSITAIETEDGQVSLSDDVADFAVPQQAYDNYAVLLMLVRNTGQTETSVAWIHKGTIEVFVPGGMEGGGYLDTLLTEYMLPILEQTDIAQGFDNHVHEVDPRMGDNPWWTLYFMVLRMQFNFQQVTQALSVNMDAEDRQRRRDTVIQTLGRLVGDCAAKYRGRALERFDYAAYFGPKSQDWLLTREVVLDAMIRNVLPRCKNANNPLWNALGQAYPQRAGGEGRAEAARQTGGGHWSGDARKDPKWKPFIEVEGAVKMQIRPA